MTDEYTPTEAEIREAFWQWKSNGEGQSRRHFEEGFNRAIAGIREQALGEGFVKGAATRTDEEKHEADERVGKLLAFNETEIRQDQFGKTIDLVYENLAGQGWGVNIASSGTEKVSIFIEPTASVVKKIRSDLIEKIKDARAVWTERKINGKRTPIQAGDLVVNMLTQIITEEADHG